MDQNRAILCSCGCDSRAAKRGCFKRGGFPIWTCPSFLVLFCPFGTFPGIFPICSGMVRGFSRLVLFLSLGLLSAPTRNSPERVRDTIWTFPEKSGKHPGLETPRFSFSQAIYHSPQIRAILKTPRFRTRSTRTRDTKLQFWGIFSTIFLNLLQWTSKDARFPPESGWCV